MYSDRVTIQPQGLAIATQDFGKPAVVSGEIKVDITATVAALPAGSYVAVVKAIGSGGTTPSAATPFTR